MSGHSVRVGEGEAERAACIAVAVADGIVFAVLRAFQIVRDGAKDVRDFVGGAALEGVVFEVDSEGEVHGVRPLCQ
jgi:hypothetical protein